MDENDKERDGLAEHAEWKARYGDEQQEVENPRELFKQVSHIALYLSYDLIDKLRFWEKETLSLSDEEIEKRIPHMSIFLDELKSTYLHFVDVDL